MTKSLKKAVKPRQLALQTIPLIVKSEAGSRLSFAIVEDESDKEIFEKFFDYHVVRIFTSALTISQTGGGNTKVISITRELNGRFNHIPVFGIIDADYTRFIPTYVLPANIFRTDDRDIEMMMFQCPEIQNELNQVIPGFDDFYRNSLIIARQIGYFRMVNDIFHFGFNFNLNLSASRFVDSQTKALSAIELQNFNNLFFSTVTQYSLATFILFKTTHQHTPDEQICRGHDMIALLGFYLKNKMSQKLLKLHLAVYYSFSSFARTQLYHDINHWGTIHNKAFFRSN